MNTQSLMIDYLTEKLSNPSYTVLRMEKSFKQIQEDWKSDNENAFRTNCLSFEDFAFDELSKTYGDMMAMAFLYAYKQKHAA